jgi:hypothetical protein
MWRTRVLAAHQAGAAASNTGPGAHPGAATGTTTAGEVGARNRLRDGTSRSSRSCTDLRTRCPARSASS